MLNTYKHLHSLTFASCLLNNQQQAPTLISINTVPSVSCCSTVMLCAVFYFLFIVYFIKCECPFQYVTERILNCGQSKYFGWVGGWVGGQTANTQTEHFRIHTFQKVVCATLPPVITNVSISAFSPVVLYFLHSYVMNRNYLLHADRGLFLLPIT